MLNGGTVNFFGPNSAAVESEALADSFVGDAFSVKSSLTSISAKISKDVFQLPAGPLGFAAGLEGRKEKYDYTPSVAVETGDVAGYGGNFLPLDKSRNVGAVFSEVNVPIVKNLEADLAVRYDRYQTVGGSTTPKASLRYQPVPQALFRTSYGEGFRAPSLQDLYAADTQGVSPNGLSDAKRCSPPVGTAPPGNNSSTDCLTQFPVTFGGNSALKPEKSKNFTLGTVLEPTNTLSVGIDYFRVRLDNTIVNGVVASTIVANEDQFSQLIVRGPSTGNGLPGPITNILQTNLNLGTTKVSGFDFDLKWRIPTTDWGRFTVSGSATYMNRYDTENLDGSYTGQVDQPDTVDGGLIPRFKSYLSANWTRGPFDLTFAQNFQKAYNDEAGDETGAPRRVRDYVTYDFQGTYSMFKSWKFTLGARNIFNTNPPYTNVGGSTVFQGGYDPNYADPRGRFIYGQVTYTLQ